MNNSNVKLVKEAFSNLPIIERRRIYLLSAIQTLASVLDLIGVASIGVLTALSVNGVQSRPPGNKVTFVLNHLGLSHFTFHYQVIALAVFALTAMVSRTLVSVWLSRATLRILSRISANITSDLVRKMFSQPLLDIRKFSIFENVYALTAGVGSIMLGVVGVVVALLADMSLLIVLLFGLMLINPLVAISTLGVFSGIGLTLYLLQRGRAEYLGNQYTKLAIQRDSELFSAFNIYRELTVRNQRQDYALRIGNQTRAMAGLNAEVSFLPMVNKYVIEATVVLGTFVIAALGFAFQDVSHAVSGLAIFSAAAARIAPSVIRVQQSLILMRSSAGSAVPTLRLIKDLKTVSPLEVNFVSSFNNHEGFSGSISFKDLSFRYPNDEKYVLSDVNLEISQGQLIAVIGPSGAGKSTLVDLLLGVINPTSGSVSISHVAPHEAINGFPGAIAYVPQDVYLIPGSIEQNVLLGFESTNLNRQKAREALLKAQLGDFVESLPQGFETAIGERGMSLSGGQRQRIGIARALLTSPKLIVFDEATSSLDGETENKIKETIQLMKGNVTQVVVAHRLSTVKHADLVIYIDNGGIRARGTFEDIAEKIPNFELLAKQMGLLEG